MQENIYLTALASCPRVGSKALRQILDFFEDAQTAWDNLANSYKEIGWKEEQLEIFLKYKKTVSLLQIQEKLEKYNITVISIDDENYPELLKEIYNPPFLLYVRGIIPKSNLTISIVGSRRPTPYGKVVAEKLAEDLACNNVLIVSGLARGIDTYAHQGALLKGSTVAVLGCGVDVIYPRENAPLFQEILRNGAVISEFPLGTPPVANNFPARNRIISGLANGTVVVEAANKSGSLITADYALEQGRDVFAVPGPITSKNSAGCHYLIKNGAKLVENAQDILEEYGYFSLNGNNVQVEKTLTHAIVLEHIGYQPVHFEDILIKSKLEIGTLSKILIQLEMAGEIRQLPGQYYVLDKINLR